MMEIEFAPNRKVVGEALKWACVVLILLPAWAQGSYELPAIVPTPTPVPTPLVTSQKTYDYFRQNYGRKPDCSHIKFIDETEKGMVPSDHREYLIYPGRNQKKLVILALNQLPTFVCKSVGKVAFYNGNPDKEEESNTPGTAGFVQAKVKGSHPDLLNLYTHVGNFSEVEITPTAIVVAGENEYYHRLRVSYARWPDIMKTIIHEAAHCATYLLESQTEASSFLTNKPWPAGIQQMAKSMVEKTGLDEGFIKEWTRVHKRFVSSDLAKNYIGETAVDDITKTPDPGFLSRYSQRDEWEDIADSFALLVLNESTVKNGDYADELVYDNVLVKVGDRAIPKVLDADAKSTLLPQSVKTWHDPCKSVSEVNRVGVPDSLAAIYTKINFLLDINFIKEKTFKDCIEPGKIGLEKGRNEENGFHRLDGDHIYRHDIYKIGHTIVHPDRDEKLFIIIGKGTLEDGGKAHNIDIWLRFNKTNGTNLPRGIYKLNWLWSANDPQPCPPLFSSSKSSWTLYVNVENKPSRSYCAVAGQILVTRSSKNFIEAGMVIQRTLKRVGGPPVQLPSAQVVGGVPVPFLASGQIIPENPNFRVYIRWQRNQ